MKAVISATEWRIRCRLTELAEAERWQIPPQLLGRIAKESAVAAAEGRPVDAPPRGRGPGRRTAGKGSVRSSAGRGVASGPSGTRGASGALQSPSVAPVAAEVPVRASGRPSEARKSPEGSFSRTGVSQAATGPHRASGGAR